MNSKTANRYLNSSTSECVFNIPVIEIPKKRELYLSIQNAVIPYSFLNCDYYNQKLVYLIGGGENITITIPEGNYTVLTLRDYLKTVMTGFTITYISLTNKFKFEHATSYFTFKKESTCFELLGFVENENVTSTSKILTSTITCNLFPIRTIYVESPNVVCSNINHATPNNASVICSIPVNNSQFGLISYLNNGVTRFKIDHIRNFTELKIKLTDQDGDLLDLNGCHWSMTIQLDII